MLDEFSSSFDDADSLILLDIYSAGENPIEGVDSATLIERIKKAGINNAVYMKTKEDAISHIISHMRRGDVLLTLGAGNVWKSGEEILKKLKMKN